MSEEFIRKNFSHYLKTIIENTYEVSFELSDPLADLKYVKILLTVLIMIYFCLKYAGQILEDLDTSSNEESD